MPTDAFRKSLKTIDGSLFHHTLTVADGTNMIVGPEAHSHYEIYYLVNGEVEYFIEGRKYVVEPGDMVIVEIGEIHKLSINLTKDYERVVIRFDQTILPPYFHDNSSLFSSLNSMSERNRLIKSNVIKKTSIPNVIKEIIDVFDKNKYWHPLLISSSIKLLVEINKIYDSTEPNHEIDDVSSRIRLAISYINSNIDKQLSLDEISKNIFLNKYYLAKLFKKETGMTVNEYIILKKMHKARNLMETGMSINQACAVVGYKNYSSFYHNYIKIFGESPRISLNKNEEEL